METWLCSRLAVDRTRKRCQRQDGWCQHREVTRHRRVLAINSLISLIKIPPLRVRDPFDRARPGIIQASAGLCFLSHSWSTQCSNNGFPAIETTRLSLFSVYNWGWTVANCHFEAFPRFSMCKNWNYLKYDRIVEDIRNGESSKFFCKF